MKEIRTMPPIKTHILKIALRATAAYAGYLSRAAATAGNIEACYYWTSVATSKREEASRLEPV